MNNSIDENTIAVLDNEEVDAVSGACFIPSFNPCNPCACGGTGAWIGGFGLSLNIGGFVIAV